MENELVPGIRVNLYVSGIYIVGAIIVFIGLLVLAQYSFFGYIAIILCMGAIFVYIFSVYWKPFRKQHRKKSSSKKPTNRSSSEEVFHIANNLFTYDNAVQVCKAYKGRLATYDEMVKAQQIGADWCNYGWSDDQNVFYPTSQAKYDKLKATPGHEHDCGHPGVNGGYIEDKTQLFGVNCYGIKPDPTNDDLALMNVTPSDPLTEQDKAMEAELSYWEKNKNKLLLRPFNSSRWREYIRV
jgi:hypothetical protein